MIIIIVVVAAIVIAIFSVFFLLFLLDICITPHKAGPALVMRCTLCPMLSPAKRLEPLRLP